MISSRGFNASPNINLVGTVDYEAYVSLQRDLKSLVDKNLKYKAHLITKLGNANILYELFLDGFHKYEDALLKSQRVVHDKGLSGSLIFLLLD